MQYFSVHGVARSQIHERTMSLRFLGIILRALRFEVSVYNVYITNHFQTTFAHWKGGVKYVSRGESSGKLLRLLSHLRPRIRPQDLKLLAQHVVCTVYVFGRQ
jgi:hypothetical protein